MKILKKKSNLLHCNRTLKQYQCASLPGLLAEMLLSWLLLRDKPSLGHHPCVLCPIIGLVVIPLGHHGGIHIVGLLRNVVGGSVVLGHSH